MGLAELFLGSKNPFAQFVAGNRNAIRGVGMGLASGPDFGQGLANAAMYANQGASQDDAYATAAKEKAEREAKLQQSIDYLKSTSPEMAGLVAAGMDPSQAFEEILARSRPKAPTPMDIREVNGDLLGIDAVGGGVRTLYDGQAPTPAAPSGYRWTPDGQGLEFIPNGPADPANTATKPPTDADVRASKLGSVVDADAKLLLGDPTSGKPGVFDALTDLGSQVGGAEIGVGGVGIGRPGFGLLTSQDYQRAANAVTNIAQSYLYAISGQAAPAGEVAKIVESVTPKPFESKKAVEEKKARLATYVQAIQMSKYDIPGTGGGEADPLGIR
jgi:hypothetical protein